MDSLQNDGSPARVVRVNWLKYIFYLWKRISTLSRVVFTLYVFLMAAQVKTSKTIYCAHTKQRYR